MEDGALVSGIRNITERKRVEAALRAMAGRIFLVIW